MVILIIGNSYSTIKGLSIELEKDLRDTLSYTVGGQSAYFSKFGIRRKSLLGKRGDFPTGLRRRVEHFLNKRDIEFKVKDSRKKPSAALL